MTPTTIAVAASRSPRCMPRQSECAASSFSAACVDARVRIGKRVHFTPRAMPEGVANQGRAQVLCRKEQSWPRNGGVSAGRRRDNRPVPDTSFRKPHVLTLTDVVGLGGAERIAEDLCVLADPERFRRSLCVTRPTADVNGATASLARLRAAGVDVVLAERRHRLDLRSLS